MYYVCIHELIPNKINKLINNYHVPLLKHGNFQSGLYVTCIYWKFNSMQVKNILMEN